MTTANRLPATHGPESGANLADILERVLDKGVVIAGDIRINLLDIELLTIKLRLVVASVDKAKEMGIDWWEDDPALSSGAGRRELADENTRLRARLEELEQLDAGTGVRAGTGTGTRNGAGARAGTGTGREPEHEREAE